MIFTKEMAEKAKALVNTVTSCVGVCDAIWIASEKEIVLPDEMDFWSTADYPDRIYKWKRCSDEFDTKRRAFIDSLIGKDL